MERERIPLTPEEIYQRLSFLEKQPHTPEVRLAASWLGGLLTNYRFRRSTETNGPVIEGEFSDEEITSLIKRTNAIVTSPEEEL